MVEAVQDVCRQGVAAYACSPRTSWVLAWPGQVVLAVSAIFWTQEVGAAMAGEPAVAADGSAVPGGKGALAAVAARCTRQLEDVVQLVRGELSNLNRCMLSVCIAMWRARRCPHMLCVRASMRACVRARNLVGCVQHCAALVCVCV